MILDAATIAGIARDAGFTYDDVATVTAVALATSGGNTAYRHRYGLPGAGEVRGLFGVDVDRHDAYAAVDHDDPRASAAAARSLTDDHDGFGWSAVWNAGTHAAHVAYAATESTRYGYIQPVRQRFAPLEVDYPMRSAQERIERIGRMLNVATQTRGLRWPTRTL